LDTVKPRSLFRFVTCMEERECLRCNLMQHQKVMGYVILALPSTAQAQVEGSAFSVQEDTSFLAEGGK